jgi:hypothetical protein
MRYWQTLALASQTLMIDKHHVELAPENETEISFFNRQLYEQFKTKPEVN